VATDLLEPGDEGQYHYEGGGRLPVVRVFGVRCHHLVDHLTVEADLIVAQLAKPIIVYGLQQFRQHLAPAPSEEERGDEADEPLAYRFAGVFADRPFVQLYELTPAAQESGQADVEEGAEILQGIFNRGSGKADFHSAGEGRHRLMDTGCGIFQVLDFVEEGELKGQ